MRLAHAGGADVDVDRGGEAQPNGDSVKMWSAGGSVAVHSHMAFCQSAIHYITWEGARCPVPCRAYIVGVLVGGCTGILDRGS